MDLTSDYECLCAICNPPTPQVSTPSLTEIIKSLVDEYGLEALLVSLVAVLKTMKNPEWIAFQLYVFARRALREITKGQDFPQLEIKKEYNGKLHASLLDHMNSFK